MKKMHLHYRIEVMCLTIYRYTVLKIRRAMRYACLVNHFVHYYMHRYNHKRHFSFSTRYYYNLYKTHSIYIHDFSIYFINLYIHNYRMTPPARSRVINSNIINL